MEAQRRRTHLVHLLQRERGVTCGLTASSGESPAFSALVREHRSQTDEVEMDDATRAELLRIRAEADASLNATSHRLAAAATATAFYSVFSRFNKLLQAVLNAPAERAVAAGPLADITEAFSLLKEATGVERAFLCGALALSPPALAQLPSRAFSDLVVGVQLQSGLVCKIRAIAHPKLLELIRAGFEYSAELREVQSRLLEDFNVGSLRESLSAHRCWQLLTEHIDKLEGLQGLLHHEGLKERQIGDTAESAIGQLVALLRRPHAEPKALAAAAERLHALPADALKRELVRALAGAEPSPSSSTPTTTTAAAAAAATGQLIDQHAATDGQEGGVKAAGVKEGGKEYEGGKEGEGVEEGATEGEGGKGGGQGGGQEGGGQEGGVKERGVKECSSFLGDGLDLILGGVKEGGVKEGDGLDLVLGRWLDAEGFRIGLEDLTFKRRIGAGGAGVTYLASYNGGGVAVKMASGGGIDDWKREVRALSTLRHPNIIRCLGVIYALPSVGLVLEYCAGGDVSTALTQPTPPGFVKEVSLGVAAGMVHLHDRQVLHRDLKGTNVLIDGPADALQVKVTDFGLAATVPDDTRNGGWLTAETGTYRWMAPEVIRHERYSKSADVFSFGGVLFELLTHEVPFGDRPSLQAAVAVGLNDIRPVLPEGVPPVVAELVRACWLAEPSARPSFRDVHTQLEALPSQLTPDECEWLDSPMGHPVYASASGGGEAAVQLS